VRREEWPFEGWYYRQNGETFGPIHSEQLRELLAAGQLRPRQAVWQKGSHGLLFVHAATAASGAAGGGSPPLGSQPASA